MIGVSPPASGPRTSGRLPYLPALDGLRGVAVLAVLLFHADVSWAVGGHLGVSAFFTLSGFLITGLLLVERDGTGRIGFGAFWARRARRLVPAMLLCFGLVAAVLALMEGPLPSGLVGDAVGAASWLANWRFIFAERPYADVFASPTPFQHFWSLAVEEQFYVLFPLLLAVLTIRRRGTGPAPRARLAVVLVALIALSTALAAVLHDPDGATARAYYGTDARVAEILVGALLATALVGPSGPKALARRAQLALGGVAVAGLVGLTYAFVTLEDQDTALYEGGFLAVAACTAAVIAGACQPGSVVGRLLANGALVRLGWISYGVYLFHWPLYLLLDERSTGLDPAPLLAVRIAATIGLATVSYVIVESPIRHGWSPRGLAQLGWANGVVAGIAVVALASGQLPSVTAEREVDAAAASAPAAGVDHAAPASAPAPAGAPATADLPSAGTPAQPAPTTTPPPPPDDGGGAPVPEGFAADPEEADLAPVPDAPPSALRVAVVGDSIGVNLATGLTIWGRERGDVVVYDLSVPGCPLSRGGERRFGTGEPFPVSPVCGWWDDPSSARRQALEEFHPDVVVAHDGVNEIFDRRLDDWDEYRRPGDPRYDAWLREEYETAMQGWIDAMGAAVVVANAPCADWDRYAKFREMGDADLRVQALNATVYPQLLAATVADLFERVCPGGMYSEEVEGVPNGRPDGFHFSDEAAAALARNWLGPIVLDVAAAPTGPSVTVP